MGRNSKLSDFEKSQIEALHGSGKSRRAIARQLKRSADLISRYVKAPTEYGTAEHTGRPSKLSARDRREIIRKASNSPKSAAEIAKECGLKVSKWTIARAIKKVPYKKCMKMKSAPNLRPHDKAARREFAKNNMDRNWKLVISY